ncbi:hypothetical protein ColKHC_06561 [Colletotrichum higginsianum]|nr:hypothetical protein ColKHC_06561 [Colletotrichum higginsianum]
MDGVFKAILKDGHPDIPFMLSWANQPWTVRWDGVDIPSGDGVILAQTYGNLEEWRKHFDWMVPLFKHPNYIRVNGKVQMMIYDPAHMGDTGKRMFEAWRIWASEDPAIGGMDVIETKIESDNPDSRGPTDAINEFGFRSGGGKDYSQWPNNPARIESIIVAPWCRGITRHATRQTAEAMWWRLRILGFGKAR